MVDRRYQRPLTRMMTKVGASPPADLAGGTRGADGVLVCVWCTRYGRPEVAVRALPAPTDAAGAAWLAVPRGDAGALGRLPGARRGMCPWCAARFAAEWALPLAPDALVAQDHCPAGPPAVAQRAPGGWRGGRVGAWARLAATTFLVGAAADVSHSAALAGLGYVGYLGTMGFLYAAWFRRREDRRGAAPVGPPRQ